MSIESAKSLIEWSRNLHARLAASMGLAQKTHGDERARELLGYLRQHELRLVELVARFEKRADPKALQTRIQDYEAHSKVDIEEISRQPFDTMSYDEIADAIFDAHNQVIALYEFLLSRAPIPEEVELLEELLNTQRHETQQIAQQVNRGRDM